MESESTNCDPNGPSSINILVSESWMCSASAYRLLAAELLFPVPRRQRLELISPIRIRLGVERAPGRFDQFFCGAIFREVVVRICAPHLLAKLVSREYRKHEDSKRWLGPFKLANEIEGSSGHTQRHDSNVRSLLSYNPESLLNGP